MNWLLPLETLPGWPEAPAVSATHMLFLMLIAPLAIGVIIAVVSFTPALGRRFRRELTFDEAPGTEHVALEGTATAHPAIEPRPRRGETEIDA